MSVSRKAKMAHLSIDNRRLERLLADYGAHNSVLLRERNEARLEALRWYKQYIKARAECTRQNERIESWKSLANYFYGETTEAESLPHLGTGTDVPGTAWKPSWEQNDRD